MSNLAVPIAPLLAGVLADQWLEPLAQHPTPWFQSLSPIIGTGPGSGLALLIVVSGVLCVATSLAGYLFPALRNVEDLSPEPTPVLQSAQA